LHLGVDAETGQIVASALTTKEVDDGVEVSTLVDQVSGSLSSFTGDGACDQDGVGRLVCPAYTCAGDDIHRNYMRSWR
jgi:hypothetical protein